MEPHKPIFPKHRIQTGTALEQAALGGLRDLRIGHITYMDYEHFQCDVAVEGGGTVHVQYILSSDSSKTGDAGSLPSINSNVIVGMISKVGVVEEWVLIGTLKSGYRSGQALMATKEHPESPESNVVERQISRKIEPSEFQVMAEKGGEALFDEGWSLLSKDLAEIKSDFITETQIANLHNNVIQTFNGRIQQGAAVRMLPDQTGLYAHPTGLSFQM